MIEEIIMVFVYGLTLVWVGGIVYWIFTIIKERKMQKKQK
jgi:hypothetical protein